MPYVDNRIPDDTVNSDYDITNFNNSDTNMVKNLLNYQITYDKNGMPQRSKIVQSIKNNEIVLNNDPRFEGKVIYDEFSQQMLVCGSLPWNETETIRVWNNFDDSALRSIMQNDYGLKSSNDLYDALKNVSQQHKVHPIRKLLDSLKWDGNEHIKHLLPDYLGAEDSEYTYQVLRLWMLGAVARVYQPGIKFDYTLILQGEQGLGKSTFLKFLSLDDAWYNDSLDSLDSDKAAQALSGTWIVELSELKSLMRTAGGMDSVKRFLSATQDKYRIPYEKRAMTFFRQCVFAGTTNKCDFLQDETGNRRFLIIYTGINEPTKDLFNVASREDILQAWAEAVHIWKNESHALVLPKNIEEEAKRIQEACSVDDGSLGIIREYVKNKETVCALEIWRYALNEDGRPSRYQAGIINDMIAHIPGWERSKSPIYTREFGNQRGFKRIPDFAKQDQKSSPQEDTTPLPGFLDISDKETPAFLQYSVTDDDETDFIDIIDVSEIPFD